MTISKGAFTAGCLVAAAIQAGMPAPAKGQTESVATWDLPAQALGETLRAIARRSGRDILFADALVRGRRAPAVRGSLTARAAVRAALAGSDLMVEDREGALLVRARPHAARQDDPGPGEIVVTGTRIRGAQSPSPQIVATRQALEDAGIDDMAGFSRMLPQNFSGGQNPGVAGGGDQGGQSNINNSTTLNLRGLGADATLTLINGHRIAYDALNQGVDVSAIPLAAIDRIEVIADGASALYGSDAVGGVVNLRLRRDYSGLETTARFGASTEGGNVQQQYSAVTGARWGSGGFMVAADYDHSTPVLASDRSYTRKLNGSQTLLARQSQTSVVLAGHQQLMPGVTFELDGQFSDRRLQKTNAFTATTDASVNGLVNRPAVRSWSVTPTLRIDLSPDWTASLEATRSVSKTDIRSRNFRSGIETPGRLIYENRLVNIEAGAEGPLVRLPGGDARLALGGGWRQFDLGIDVTQTSAGVTRTTRRGTETRRSLFAYGELSVPLVGPDNRMPLVEQLQLSAAVRYERYQGIEQVATPKLGIIHAPHRDVTLRFSWGKSYKIPTLDQVNRVEAGGLLPGSLFAPQPVPALPSGATVLVLSGGNPDLRSERATTWTASFEVRPQFLEGLKLGASWFDVDYRDRIASPISDTLSALANPAFADFVLMAPSAAAVQAIVDGLPQAITNATGQPFDPARVGAILDGRLRNSAHEHARGVDLDIEYRISPGPRERLTLSATASYLDASRQLSPGQPVLARSGVIFTPPTWRVRTGGSWDRGNTGFTAFFNYSGGVYDNRLASPGDIPAFPTVDLSARIRTTDDRGLLHGLEFRLSALNVLDEKPHTIFTSDPAAIPYDSTNQSSIGRFISLAVTKSW
ncbi:TonB-dependent receptor plug domain-containing protein [Sphingobium lignivorans]|uniref:Outer membrane receptor protein involved in Fe transport n=1 Tax=Sphingobium lignivorans TaxID=2735886 RepID=A0ABR6NH72_9SPHN|nr:TonB-dependent receptor [Sphingobium lignivorans]MBB5986624.1 outer membrane receptor protein involved in Fe transport [Sphingobium lignivorans]